MSETISQTPGLSHKLNQQSKQKQKTQKLI